MRAQGVCLVPVVNQIRDMKLEDLRPLSGNGKRLYVETYGCQMNVGDSEILVSIMQDEGYRYTEDIAQADVILVNSGYGADFGSSTVTKGPARGSS